MIASAPYPNPFNNPFLPGNDSLSIFLSCVSCHHPLYPDFQIGRDFEKIENARRLSDREFSYNKQLGYLSLNVALKHGETVQEVC